MNEVTHRDRAQIIAKLNDEFRTTLTGGTVLMTAGVEALGPQFVAKALASVRAFNEFTEDNDPHREHDFGAFSIRGQKLFWKIDYYDQSMRYGSENPCDPEATCRVLTVMLAEEY
ncbi:hypothetical protein GGD81_001862 [Rhodobium orientis]|uniref:DUF3768 domain-containing protein n=1 Tax=Rhodobium orientis TaxID=34017 RepID=A0A327JSI7_9HYPH|nr:DUF3768 domain-containing protein [Rhodobium orientis]MBB4302826.1 hypothetical protein [Rhodobium orientis]RAI26268.1 hypothetical protein CH339_14885 [Rhodobium orientis]